MSLTAGRFVFLMACSIASRPFESFSREYSQTLRPFESSFENFHPPRAYHPTELSKSCPFESSLSLVLLTVVFSSRHEREQ